MGRTILGPEERVSAFQRADFSNFVASHYGPERLVLSAAGGVDHDAILRQAEALFGHHAPRGPEAPEPAAFRSGERREFKKLEQVHFAMGFESPGYRDPDFYTAQIYAQVMGGGMSSRLFQEIREKRGLCYSIFAQAGAYADTGMMTIYAGTSEQDISGLANLTVDEMRRACSTLTEAEVARGRAQMKAGLLMGLESPTSRAERMARLLAIWGRVTSVAETVERIDAVGLADVARFAEQTASAGSAALALYGPGKAAPTLDELKLRLAA
jgi:predicted Zn-dependent peptidase